MQTEELIGNEELLKKIDVSKYKEYGELTVKDIVSELKKPGLDPRSEVQAFEFANIYSMDDVKAGMVIPGIVTNLTRFGAFVDIGVKQDGLVHVSEIANKYIQDPGEVLKLNQHVKVKVMEVDAARKRIALSIKQADDNARTKPLPSLPKQQMKEAKKEDTPMEMGDALALLKKKFGK